MTPAYLVDKVRYEYSDNKEYI